jgi:hypothetical protein
MVSLTDTELLDLLGTAYAPKPLEPPASSTAALIRTVAQQNVAPVRRRAAALQYGARRASMLLAAGGLVVGGATAAAAATGHLPQSIASIAHDIGIGAQPQPRPALTDQIADLRTAIAQQDYGKAEKISRSLESRGTDLSEAERTQLDGQIADEWNNAPIDPATADAPGALAPDDPNHTPPVTTPDGPVDTSPSNPGDTPTSNAPADLPSDPAAAPDVTVTPTTSDPSQPTQPTEPASATPTPDGASPAAP